MQPEANVDAPEIEKFDALAHRWWDPSGDFKPLHDINPARLDYIRQRTDLNAGPTVDIGCGGGLIAEPMARLGASVTGIDVTDAAIIAAKAHAQTMQLSINYQTTTAEELAASGVTFDVICASEVIEHVVDRQIFINAIN